MNKYLKLLSIVLVLITICMSINMKSISGFFHDEEKITNKIVIGSVETSIMEEFDTKPIVAGDEFKKIVTVKNNGNSPCYVRLKVLISPEQYKDELNLDINTTDWEYLDGYYYYKKILGCNEETVPIFTKLYIPNGLEKGDTFDINIYSESLQYFVNDNDNTVSKSYYDIFKNI